MHLFALVLALLVPQGFTLQRIATVPGARELAFSAAGDLYVGTRGGDVYVVPHADTDAPQIPRVYAHFDDAPASGIAYANGALYVGTQHALWRVANGKRTLITWLRTGNPPADSDGDVHRTTSVALNAKTIYTSVGSSCNACIETDSTRATIGKVGNGRYVPVAKRIRNAIGLAVDPATGALWATDAGQDELPPGHPYEFFDDVTAHAPPADYGWPYCYENGRHKPGTRQDCAGVVTPRVVFPAYETPIGAVFYPLHARGRYPFPMRYAGGAFVTLHGSWHGPAQGLAGFMPPLVAFVPMRGDKPARPVNWNDPRAQWTPFVEGYQEGASANRSGRPTGIAVGPQGDLFVADDQTGAIYRVRYGVK